MTRALLFHLPTLLRAVGPCIALMLVGWTLLPETAKAGGFYRVAECSPGHTGTPDARVDGTSTAFSASTSCAGGNWLQVQSAAELAEGRRAGVRAAAATADGMAVGTHHLGKRPAALPQWVALAVLLGERRRRCEQKQHHRCPYDHVRPSPSVDWQLGSSRGSSAAAIWMSLATFCLRKRPGFPVQKFNLEFGLHVAPFDGWRKRHELY